MAIPLCRFDIRLSFFYREGGRDGKVMKHEVGLVERDGISGVKRVAGKSAFFRTRSERYLVTCVVFSDVESQVSPSCVACRKCVPACS